MSSPGLKKPSKVGPKASSSKLTEPKAEKVSKASASAEVENKEAPKLEEEKVIEQGKQPEQTEQVQPAKE